MIASQKTPELTMEKDYLVGIGNVQFRCAEKTADGTYKLIRPHGRGIQVLWVSPDNLEQDARGIIHCPKGYSSTYVYSTPGLLSGSENFSRFRRILEELQ